MEMSDSEYESESEYEYESLCATDSDDEPYLYNEIQKFNYFKNCTSCRQVKNRQQILLTKCDALHDLTHMITDYYGCDKCCKLRHLFDDYILPFTKLYKYPEYDEVHEIMKNDVQRKDYTLELHLEMKTIYENIDTFDFYKWHQEKKNYYEDTLCGYFEYYQRVSHIFMKILYYLHRNDKLHYDYVEETNEFLNQMIVHNHP